MNWIPFTCVVLLFHPMLGLYWKISPEFKNGVSKKEVNAGELAYIFFVTITFLIGIFR